MTEHRLTDAPVLKPCPFCGGHATKVHHYFANRKGDDGEFKHVVRFHGMCTECGATGATKDTLHERNAESRAVAAWNRRAIETELSAPDTVRLPRPGRKTGGTFEADGKIVAEFTTDAGVPMVVFQFDVLPMFHIYRADQIAPKEST